MVQQSGRKTAEGQISETQNISDHTIETPPFLGQIRKKNLRGGVINATLTLVVVVVAIVIVCTKIVQTITYRMKNHNRGNTDNSNVNTWNKN